MFDKDEVFTPLETALATGQLDVTKILAKGTRHPCTVGNGSARTGSMNTWGRFSTSIEDDECVWSVRHLNKSCCVSSHKQSPVACDLWVLSDR